MTPTRSSPVLTVARCLSFVAAVSAPAWLPCHARAQSEWVWQPISMVSPADLMAGVYPGGEGCQYPQVIAMDAIDGSFILYGTDVGGMYRSTNGGRRFQPCNIGVETTGAVGFAMDPRHLDRCLAIGDGGGNQFNIFGGVHLSTNRAATWSRSLTKWLDGNYNWDITKAREQVAYDASSFSQGLGYCTIAYWAEEGNPQEPGGKLYKTFNGGSGWFAVAAPAAYGGADGAHSCIKVHPALGYVYIANTNGFYRSIDGGTNFTRVLSGSFKSLDVIASAPDSVWIARAGTATILRSFDAGATFTSFPAAGIGQIFGLKVSPVDATRLLASDASRNNQRFYSVNGGTNWTACGKDMSRCWFPPSILYDDRSRSHVWHPTNAAAAWGAGPGDIISRTTNSGALLSWANNGNNGIMLGGGFNFNPANPDTVYFGSQDYNGALTTNGGKTWDFINLSINNTDNDPWGWVYGAYAADSRLLFGGNRAYGQSAYQLWITFDRGANSSMKVANLTGLQVSYGDPADTNVLFCWSYRSADRGQTWTQMNGCQGVFTHDRLRNTLYGANGTAVVSSTNKGVSWTTVATLSANVLDVAVAAGSNRLYVVTAGNLWRCDSPGYAPVQITQPNGSASSVAVDPKDEQCVFVAGTPGTWRKMDCTVVRSTNGCLTWEKLNNRADLQYDGGNCASWCRVHPRTRDLWVGTVCFGMWRFGPRGPFTVSLSLTNSGPNPQALLSWNGAAPPYVVQTSPAPAATQWLNLATSYQNSAPLALTNAVGFFRIQGQSP